MKIRLAVLDMAGTTVKDDNEVEMCFAKALRKAGFEISDERILALQGLSKRHVFKTLWAERLSESHFDFKKSVDDNYQEFKNILEAHYTNNPAKPQPYAEELFAFLKENNIKIALTTGFYREVTNTILNQLGWDKGLDENFVSNGDSIIDMSISSDDISRGRPAPDMIFKAMKQFEILDPSQVAKIGDTPSDLQSGFSAKAGLNFGILNGTHTRELLEKQPHTKLLPNLKSFQEELELHIVNERVV